MHKRPDRTTYFMQLAIMVAERSTCNRARVGAVLVANKRIVSTGYNGSVPGALHCLDVGCLLHKGHCIRTSHAEINAILNMEHSHENMELYCTHAPCWNCYKALKAIDVKRIYCLIPYLDEQRDAGIVDLQTLHIPIVHLKREDFDVSSIT